MPQASVGKPQQGVIGGGTDLTGLDGQQVVVEVLVFVHVCSLSTASLGFICSVATSLF
jgi:hypothetical protein